MKKKNASKKELEKKLKLSDGIIKVLTITIERLHNPTPENIKRSSV